MKFKEEILSENPKIKIVLGDSITYLKELKTHSIDICLTDPPYGIMQSKGFSGAGGFSGKGKPIPRRQYPDTWDKKRPEKEYFEELLRVAKKVIIFGGNYFADILPQGTHWIVWDKLNTMPTFGDCELLWTNIKRKSVKKIVFQWNGVIGKEKERFHPTQKPVGLIKLLLETYTKEGETIIDPFMGSGSIGVACAELKRNYTGVEIEEKYYEISKSRLLKMLSCQKLF